MFRGHLLNKLKRKISPALFFIKPLVLFFFIIISFTTAAKAFSSLLGKLILLPNLLLITTADKTQGNLRMDPAGNVNLLLLGIGGGSHDGGDLTDTIITASLNLNTKKVRLITVPRDTWVEEIRGKINYAYHLGETKNKGTGIILTKATISQILGIPVHYAFLVDFHALEKLVDLLGGVDVTVENTFEDNQYPIEGRENDLCGKDETELEKVNEQNIGQIFPCRFETVRFEKGKKHLDGKQALKFVRTRHAPGEEGTDFARSKRQLKLLEAIKNKIARPEVFLNPAVSLRLLSDFKEDIDTDLTSQQLLFLGKIFSQTNLSIVKSLSLDEGTENNPGLLLNPPVSDYGTWVLIPRGGNWQEIHERVSLFLEQ